MYAGGVEGVGFGVGGGHFGWLLERDGVVCGLGFDT